MFVLGIFYLYFKTHFLPFSTLLCALQDGPGWTTTHAFLLPSFWLGPAILQVQGRYERRKGDWNLAAGGFCILPEGPSWVGCIQVLSGSPLNKAVLDSSYQDATDSIMLYCNYYLLYLSHETPCGQGPHLIHSPVPSDYFSFLQIKVHSQ